MGLISRMLYKEHLLTAFHSSCYACTQWLQYVNSLILNEKWNTVNRRGSEQTAAET